MSALFGCPLNCLVEVPATCVAAGLPPGLLQAPFYSVGYAERGSVTHPSLGTTNEINHCCLPRNFSRKETNARLFWSEKLRCQLFDMANNDGHGVYISGPHTGPRQVIKHGCLFSSGQGSEQVMLCQTAEINQREISTLLAGPSNHRQHPTGTTIDGCSSSQSLRLVH